MGFETIIGAASLAFSVVSTVAQMDAQEEAQQAQERANEEQRGARNEQKAVQSAQAAAERRQQIREERVKRARLLQSSANSGVTGSSGEAGAAGGLSTQLGTNLGFNLGAKRAADSISAHGQNAADFLSSASNSTVEANQWGQMQSLGLNIFEKSGGFNSIFPKSTQSPAPVRDAVITPVG